MFTFKIRFLLLLSLSFKDSSQNNYGFTKVNSLLESPDDIDMWRDTPTLILSRGFGVETHTVTTKDGYILTMFRIIYPKHPTSIGRSKRKPPVYLQHGVFASSSVWVVNSIGNLTTSGQYIENDGTLINDCDSRKNSTGNTIGFVLAACGFDVWLGNFRGNTYSSQHLKLKITDLQFWNTTIDQLALKDNKAMINYIIKKTGYEKISYVGHSLAGLTMFMLLALEPSFASKLKVFVAISPTPYAQNANQLEFPFTILLTKILNSLIPLTGVPFLKPEPNAKFNTLIDFLCNPVIGNQICQFITSTDFNFLKFIQNERRVKSNFVHSLSRMSLQLFHHAGQMFLNHRFQKFDYGCAGNLIHYKQCQVPVIRLRSVRLKKIAVFYGPKDQIAGPRDAQFLKRDLGIKKFWREFEAPSDWGHYDYLLNYEAGRYSVPKILQFLKEAQT